MDTDIKQYVGGTYRSKDGTRTVTLNEVIPDVPEAALWKAMGGGYRCTYAHNPTGKFLLSAKEFLVDYVLTRIEAEKPKKDKE